MNVIFGASGFAKQVFLIYRRVNKANKNFADEIDYFVVEDKDIDSGATLHGIPIIGESSFFSQFENIELTAFIAIGSPTIRKDIVEKISKWNPKVYFPSLIDPNVIMDEKPETIKIGKGVVICAGSILETDVEIGDFSHINLHCTLAHDVHVSSFSTISPRTCVAGNVRLGSGVFCGMGTLIIDGLTIADNSFLGAGTVVIKDITEAGTYIGAPARKIK